MKFWRYLYEDWPVSWEEEDEIAGGMVLCLSAMHRPQSNCIIDYKTRSEDGRVLIYTDEEIDGEDVVLLAENVGAWTWQ